MLTEHGILLATLLDSVSSAKNNDYFVKANPTDRGKCLGSFGHLVDEVGVQHLKFLVQSSTSKSLFLRNYEILTRFD